MSDDTHAYCRWYGHQWTKSDLLTARQKKGYRIDVCKRCDKARRVWEG